MPEDHAFRLKHPPRRAVSEGMSPAPPMVVPFRWNVGRRESLGTLAAGPVVLSYPALTEDLVDCAAKVVALAGDSDLFFVGRSPESLFDLLGGLLADTSRRARMTMLHFSMRGIGVTELAGRHPDALPAIRAYLAELRLDPAQLARRERAVAFVDLVYGGDTFGNLIALLRHWTVHARGDWPAIRRKIRLLGITERSGDGRKTWRWQQNHAWARRLRRSAIRNVSVPVRLWDCLGNWQPKLCRSYPPEMWGDPSVGRPIRDEPTFRALRLAAHLFRSGLDAGLRDDFAGRLAESPAVRFRWLRRLINELRHRDRRG